MPMPTTFLLEIRIMFVNLERSDRTMDLSDRNLGEVPLQFGHQKVGGEAPYPVLTSSARAKKTYTTA